MKYTARSPLKSEGESLPLAAYRRLQIFGPDVKQSAALFVCNDNIALSNLSASERYTEDLIPVLSDHGTT